MAVTGPDGTTPTEPTPEEYDTAMEEAILAFFITDMVTDTIDDMDLDS